MQQLSTYALTLFRKDIKLKEDDGKSTIIGKFLAELASCGNAVNFRFLGHCWPRSF